MDRVNVVGEDGAVRWRGGEKESGGTGRADAPSPRCHRPALVRGVLRVGGEHAEVVVQRRDDAAHSREEEEEADHGVSGGGAVPRELRPAIRGGEGERGQREDEESDDDSNGGGDTLPHLVPLRFRGVWARRREHPLQGGAFGTDLHPLVVPAGDGAVGARVAIHGH